MTEESVNFHPVELAAHFLLSNSLDNLHENFLLLHESQRILLARLHDIETRLTNMLETLDSPDPDFAEYLARVKKIRKRLQDCATTNKKTEARLDSLNC